MKYPSTRNEFQNYVFIDSYTPCHQLPLSDTANRLNSRVSSVDAARRVDRFLTRKEGSSQNYASNNMGSPIIDEKIESNHSPDELISHCSQSMYHSHHRCMLEGPPERKKYVIEGIHGPILTEKVLTSIDPRSREYRRTRKCHKFKRFVAAKQSERAKKFGGSMDGVLQILPLVTPSDDILRTSYSSSESPTTVMADISSISSERSQRKQAFSFIRVENSSIKGIINHAVGIKPKKRLTWWDDEENADKPFLLKSDESMDWDYDDFDDGKNNVFGSGGCTHDNLQGLFEDYKERLVSSVMDLFESKLPTLWNETIVVQEASPTNSVKSNFASYSEDLSNDYNEGCTTPSKMLVKDLRNVLPPVCHFETGSL